MPRATKRATVKQREREEGRETDAPDRPDQVPIDPEDEAEVVDILGKRDAKADGREEPAPEEPSDDARAEAVQSREQRTREEEEDDRPLRSEGVDADEGGRRTRLQRRARANGHDDGEDEPYSRRVKRRINREIALRKRTETQLAEERAARQKIEQRITKIERAQVDEQGEASLREIDAKIKQAAGELAKAKEESNTAREVELQIELGELQGQKVRLQAQLDQQREERTRAAAADTTERGEQSIQQPDSGRSGEWIRANRRWWKTSRWASAHQDAITHDETILAEIEDGELDFVPYSDEHFEELARRLKGDYPDLEVRTIDGEVFEDEEVDDYDDERGERMNGRDDDYDDQRGARNRRASQQRRPQARAPMGGLGGRDGRRERNEVELARRGKITLTEQDKQTMRVFKLDPNDPAHKKYFARERARTILSNANRGNRS